MYGGLHLCLRQLAHGDDKKSNYRIKTILLHTNRFFNVKGTHFPGKNSLLVFPRIRWHQATPTYFLTKMAFLSKLLASLHKIITFHDAI